MMMGKGRRGRAEGYSFDDHDRDGGGADGCNDYSGDSSCDGDGGGDGIGDRDDIDDTVKHFVITGNKMLILKLIMVKIFFTFRRRFRWWNTEVLYSRSR